MNTLVEARDLACGYEAGRPVLSDVTFAVPAGSIVAVLGPNGGGKTTLLKALLGQTPQRSGTVRIEGEPAYVAQTHATRLDMPVTALDVALMGAYGRTPWFKRLTTDDRAAARQALARVGLHDEANTRFGALSGGQRQRALIARALTQDAPVLILDEPLSGVDATSATKIEALLKELREDGRAILVSTHDVTQAANWDLALCLNHRQVAFGRPDEILTGEVLAATYGAELIMLPGGQSAVRLDHHDHDHAH